MTAQLRLVKEQLDYPAQRSSSGTVSYRAYLGDRWVGWVFDHRDWKGWTFGGRRWHAAWREDDDAAARANTFDLPSMKTRREATLWLQRAAGTADR